MGELGDREIANPEGLFGGRRVVEGNFSGPSLLF
jgi:hypothetical protein